MNSRRSDSQNSRTAHGVRPVVVLLDWSPVSESNRRDHWSKRHQRSKEAKAAWEHSGADLHEIRGRLSR